MKGREWKGEEKEAEGRARTEGKRDISKGENRTRIKEIQRAEREKGSEKSGVEKIV